MFCLHVYREVMRTYRQSDGSVYKLVKGEVVVAEYGRVGGAINDAGQ